MKEAPHINSREVNIVLIESVAIVATFPTGVVHVTL